MSQLKPDTKYIYERANGVVYAREFGAGPGDRTVVGYDYDPITGQKIPHQWDSRTNDGRPLHDHMKEDQLWGQIRREAKTNPTLQDALAHAIMIYRLTKTDE
ncbi:hypothetical protein [Haliscomenobacter sp.]|uniref:hypothetical protein n=1 Tax=Haliscomenobacter sp. TaxID=2717303 RepID=UPI0033650888